MGALAMTDALLITVGVGPTWLGWSGLALLAVVWASTILVQVPLHRRLSGGYDGAAVTRVVQTNWVRTTAWTLRVGVAGVLLLG